MSQDQPVHGLTGQCVLLAALWGLASVLASIEDHLLLSGASSCSCTVVTTTGHLVGKDAQCCTGMFGERISCQKDQYSCQDVYKERKGSPSIRLANDNIHPSF